MAIAFDACSAFDTSVGGTTFPHTIDPSGALGNWILILDTFDGTSAPSSVTYGGVAMTNIPGATVNFAGSVPMTRWYLLNPPTGTNNIVMTGSVTPQSARATSFNNVTQSAPVGSLTATGNASPITVTNTSVAATDMLYDFAVLAGVNPTIGAGQTYRGTTLTIGTNRVFGSTQVGSGAMTHTFSGTHNWATTSFRLQNTDYVPATTVAVGQASETDTAQPITVKQGQIIPVGMAVETDSAFSVVLAAAQPVAVGQATETDSALPITVKQGQIIPVGMAVETDTAFSITPAQKQFIPVGIAIETDSAFSITPIIGTPVVSPPFRMPSPFPILSRPRELYTFEICDRALNPFAQLTKASGRNYSLALNRPGSAGFSLALTDPIAAEITPLSTALVIKRKGRIVYSGPIWTTEESLPDERFNVTSVGWFEELNHKIINSKVSFGPIEATLLAWNRLNQAMIDEIAFAAQEGVTAPIPCVNQGSSSDLPTTVNRDITIERFTNLGQFIQQLADIEDGYDWHIDPATKLFSFTASDIGTLKPGVMLLYQRRGGNISSMSRQIDGSAALNHFWVGGKNGIVDVTDPSLSENGVHEEYASLSDVTDVGTLGAYAAAEVAFRANPRVTHQVTPKKQADGLAIPRPFDDYEIGDRILLTADLGRMQLKNQPIRVFGFSVNIDENGSEAVSNLQTTYS